MPFHIPKPRPIILNIFATAIYMVTKVLKNDDMRAFTTPKQKDAILFDFFCYVCR